MENFLVQASCKVRAYSELTMNVDQFAPDNDGTGKLKKDQVISGLLLKTD